MTTYCVAAAEGLDFGDVCVGPFLADIRVDSDTVPVFKVKDEEKNLAFTAWRENIRGSGRLVVTSGAIVDQAIVVSDSCAVETAIGRGQTRAKGRIWLAPLCELKTAGAVSEVESAPDAFGRLLLKPDDANESHWVVELQRAFPADAASVRHALESDRSGFLLHGLQPEVADDLRARWAAFSCRCGPLVARDNASHIIDRLEESGIATADAQSAADAVVAVAASSWVFEGSSLEAAGANGAPAGSLNDDVAAMIQELTALREATTKAIDNLTLIRSPN